MINLTNRILQTIDFIILNTTLMVLHTGTLSQRAAKKIPNGAAHSSAGNFISFTWCILLFDG